MHPPCAEIKSTIAPKMVDTPCPHCGIVQKASLFLTISVDVDPGLKMPLLSGRLATHSCSACGLDFHLDHPIFYLDKLAGFVVLYWPANYPLTKEYLRNFGEEEKFRAYYRQMPTPRFRIVRGYVDLIEKIKIFDARLDDRAVEWWKWRIQAFGDVPDLVLVETPKGGAVPPRFVAMTAVSDGEALSFHNSALVDSAIRDGMPRDKAAALIQMVPRAKYEEAAHRLAVELPWPTPVYADLMLVDQDYVRTFARTLAARPGH